MPMNAVFDTNIIIDALNGVAAADVEYSRYARVFISHITWMEVLVGAQDDDMPVTFIYPMPSSRGSNPRSCADHAQYQRFPC